MWALLRAIAPPWLLPLAAGVVVIGAAGWWMLSSYESAIAGRAEAEAQVAALNVERDQIEARVRALNEQTARIVKQLESANAVAEANDVEERELRRELDTLKQRISRGESAPLPEHYVSILHHADCVLRAVEARTAAAADCDTRPAHPRSLTPLPGPPEPRPASDRG